MNKKVIMTVMVFGFIANFTKALWSPIQVVADGVGATTEKTINWLNS